MNQVGFYQVGGDLRFEHPSYVTRKSDRELYDRIKAGEFCYVFNSRQMGKSSLGIQIFKQLKKDGYACCFISLAEIGSATTIDQWYFTLAHSIARKLNIAIDVSDWWNQYRSLTSVNRFSQFIEKVLLREIDQNHIAIFIDEIDSILRLKFNTDDFFALIRACYNNRAKQPEYKRLTFTLLGVSTPSNLIRNQNCSPFNIGTAISLQGFELAEVKPLIKGLSGTNSNPEEILAEILSWTGGQPFLTQKFCKLVAELTNFKKNQNAKQLVEKIAREKIIDNWENQDNPEHLKTIYNRLLEDGDLTRKRLWLYHSILQNQKISSDNSLEQLELQLSGLVVNQQGKLKPYNRVYAEVFNQNWLNHQLSKLNPYAERIIAWKQNKDKSLLLREKELADFQQLERDKNLSDRERDYLHASQQEINSKRLSRVLVGFGSFVAGLIISGYFIYDKYASCPIGEGIIGEKIEGVCFRTLQTSGEKVAFSTGSNFHLIHGTKAFKNANYKEAERLFQYAVVADDTDPVAKIYLNNTRARLKDNPIKIAVVVSLDSFQDAAKQVLRGVSDAQDLFNQSDGKNGRLLEIIIVNDDSKKEVSPTVADKLVNDRDILAIMGHHSSESTQAAIPIYEKNKIALVTGSSSSSNLNSPVFFRTISSAAQAARKYADYIKDDLKIDEISIAYNPESIYSNALKETFVMQFKNKKGKINETIDLYDPSLDIEKTINNLHERKIKALFMISNVDTNSIVTAFAKTENSYIVKNKKEHKIKLISSMALSEDLILQGKESVEGLTIVTPCIAKDKKSEYIKTAEKTWGKKIYWRTATSYDATQVLIDAIKRSEELTRKSILDNLESDDFYLPVEKTSGLGVKFNKSDRNNPESHSNNQRNYCIFNIEKGEFKLIKN